MLRLFPFRLWLASLALGAAPVFASELVTLPIKDIQQTRNGSAVQVVVTFDMQTCKHSYKGLYLEPVAVGHGQLRFEVRAIAAPRVQGNCTGDTEPRTDSLILNASTSDRYDFIAVQPK